MRSKPTRSSSSAFGAENGTWRNAFLSGAHELRHGSFGTPTATAAADLINALSVDQMLDTIAIRIDGPKAWHEHIVLSFVITDTDTQSPSCATAPSTTARSRSPHQAARCSPWTARP